MHIEVIKDNGPNPFTQPHYVFKDWNWRIYLKHSKVTSETYTHILQDFSQLQQIFQNNKNRNFITLNLDAGENITQGIEINLETLSEIKKDSLFIGVAMSTTSDASLSELFEILQILNSYRKGENYYVYLYRNLDTPDCYECIGQKHLNAIIDQLINEYQLKKEDIRYINE